MVLFVFKPMESAKIALVEVMDIILSITSTTIYLVFFYLFTIFARNFKH